MEPKFQSSFIPKGPVTSGTGSSFSPPRRGEGKSLVSFFSYVIFIISIVSAVGVFGYKYYLKYNIGRMSADLENARTAIDPETIEKLIRLDNRIISTEQLISKHETLLPLFRFLELSTLKTVRFNEFRYIITNKGIEVSMKGEARGYAALALQSDIFNKSHYFKESIFSNLNLNERGDVAFSFAAILDPSLVSYSRQIENVVLPTSASSTTSTTSPNVITN